jgi:hypothetical protein
VWNTDTWTWGYERILDDDCVNCLVVHGDKLLSGFEDGTVTVWGS